MNQMMYSLSNQKLKATEADKEEAKTNNKSLWKYVNSKRKTRDGIGNLKTGTDNLLATKDRDKAEVLNNFFGSVFVRTDDHLGEELVADDMPDV